MNNPLYSPTAQQLREFYPVSTSLPEQKIEELFNYVCNILFVDMFGYSATKQIIDGDIPTDESADFIGFQKFVALCCAYQEVRDPLVSTNFGAKIIDRQGSINPSNQQKGITLIPLEKAISTHYKIALRLLNTYSCKDLPEWGGYYSYKITRL